MLLNCGVGEDSWESLGLQGDPTSPFWRKSNLNIHWKDWCWSWSSNALATWCEELTHWKRPWCWERLKGGGDGDDRGWDGWMASLTPWTWIWTGSGSWYGQGSLACCSPWGCKELDMTEQDWTVTVTYDVEHLFLCFCESPLVKYLLRSLAHFLIKLFVFLLSSFKIFLYPLDNSPLSDISFANIFSLLVKF